MIEENIDKPKKINLALLKTNKGNYLNQLKDTNIVHLNQLNLDKLNSMITSELLETKKLRASEIPNQ